MIFGAYVALAVLGLPTPPPAPAQHRAERPAAKTLRNPVIDSSDLYSLRARRRFANYLRLRILELRAANLERAAEVVEHRMPLCELLGETADPGQNGCERGISRP
jgi:hypothetical protein